MASQVMIDVDGTPTAFKSYNQYPILIQPTDTQAFSTPFELRPSNLYTIKASKMTGTENDVYIKMQIWDITKQAWDDLAQGGSIVKMWQDREIITIGGVGGIVRLYKSPSAGQQIGCFMAQYN